MMKLPSNFQVINYVSNAQLYILNVQLKETVTQKCALTIDLPGLFIGGYDELIPNIRILYQRMLYYVKKIILRVPDP